MAHPYVRDPVVFELDDIASELEKTGNADLATLVDEVSADIVMTQRRTVSAKKSTKTRSKKNRQSSNKAANVNHSASRARVAAAMRKIARTQVAELEDIASELLREGEKKAALEVLKIAEDLDSEYAYSEEGKHTAPKTKGDASKLYNREKANKPNAQMSAEEKARLVPPFGEEGEGYPMAKKSAFDKQLDKLIRMAAEGDELPELPAAKGDADDMDLGGLDLEGDKDSEDSEDGDESDDELDLEGDDSDEEDSDEESYEDELGLEGDAPAEDALPGLDAEEEPEGEDFEAAEMTAGEPEPKDMDAAAIMSALDEEGEEPAGDEGSEPDGDEGFDFSSLDDTGAEDSDEEDSEEESDEDDQGLEDDSEEDDDSDVDAGALGTGVGAAIGAVGGPVGALAGGALGNAISGSKKLSSTDQQKMAALVKKLTAKGEKGLAARVAKLARK